ncbi:MAG: YicC family protein [Desulfuromonadales bacterium]|nr:YicC family protein [Desulfuromonadales bacterium]
MVKSMTGYGRGQAEVDGLSFSVEIKAVNHRYGDISIKAPRLLAPLENDVKKQVSGVLKRGKIDVFISQDHTGEMWSKPVINKSVAAAYISAFKQLKELSGLTDDISLDFLAGQKDVLCFQDADIDSDALADCLTKAVASALDALLTMRQNEGAATADDIARRLKLIEDELAQINICASRVPTEWQHKLTERLSRLQDNGGDPQRVAQEIAIFADRCDISEEISRFNSHLEQFDALMNKPEPVGRQMDFLVQELNREANTMGSKSNDAELTRHVVILKSELEKIREQVQNIE